MKKMLKQYLHGRVYVFIDAANIESAAKHLGWHLDYRKLVSLFAKEHLRSIRHYCVHHGTTNQNAFFTVLKRLGFTLVTKPLKIIVNDSEISGYLRKANFDVEIAVDAVAMIEDFETAVLFSGDSDFAYLIHFLRRKSKNVVVISTRNHIARELIEECNKYIDLQSLKHFIVRKISK